MRAGQFNDTSFKTDLVRQTVSLTECHRKKDAGLYLSLSSFFEHPKLRKNKRGSAEAGILLTTPGKGKAALSFTCEGVTRRGVMAGTDLKAVHYEKGMGPPNNFTVTFPRWEEENRK